MTPRHPHDRHYPGRPHRVYAALTNHCDRACPWCCACASPRGRTWLSVAAFRRALPRAGGFEVQLEGGEPTLHRDLPEFVDAARAHPRCRRVVLCTNGAVLPRSRPALRDWLARLGEPLTLKLSCNHHLLAHDPGLPALGVALRDSTREIGGDRLFVLNVRLRSGSAGDDARVTRAVAEAGLASDANVVHLQRYGFAAGETMWDPPSPVYDDYSFINPDGAVFGPDLVARAEAMRSLP